MRNPFSRKDRKYADINRLADVMALIQVLALDKHSHRSEKGLSKELQGLPESANSWTEVAASHPEFFRVQAEKDHSVALIARHATPPNDQGVCELDPEFVGKLLEAAIELHDRQIRQRERWTHLIPIWVAIIAGFFSIIGIYLKVYLDMP